MPPVLFVLGWRVFFYANESNEPIHAHCRKGNKECKYWLDVENFDLVEAHSFNMTGRDVREIKKILFEHFEHIESEWKAFKERAGV
jgi:hypothetical protein